MVKSLEEKNDRIISEFKNEIAMYAKMKHENVGTILGLCQDTKPHYMIMDYTDWVSLFIDYIFIHFIKSFRFKSIIFSRIKVYLKNIYLFRNIFLNIFQRK